MFSQANVGSTDRLIRAIAGVALAVLPFLLGWSGLLGTLAPIVGLVLIFTAFARFCPLYRVIGTSTCSKE